MATFNIYKKIASDSLYAFNEQDLYKKWHSFERKFNIIHTKLRHNNNSLIIYTGLILEMKYVVYVDLSVKTVVTIIWNVLYSLYDND